jgi:hypothetical protein
MAPIRLTRTLLILIVAAAAAMTAMARGTPPSPAGGYPPIQLSTPQKSPYGTEFVLQTGPSGSRYWIEDNPWGAGPITRGTYQGLNGMTFESQYGIAPVDANGNIAWRASWKWPMGENEVKAYPGAIFGAKPGWFVPNCPCPNGSAVLQQEDGQPITTVPIGPTPGTFLPLQVGSGLPPIHASFAFHHFITPPPNTPEGQKKGQGHVTFDLWLQKTPTQEHGGDTGLVTTHEIMIPVNFWGRYGEWDKRPEDWRNYCRNCVFEYQGIRFHVLHAAPKSRSWSQYWALTIFEPERPLSEDTIRTFDLSAFVNFLRNRNKPGTNTPMVSPTDYLVDIEFGVEPIYGEGDTQVWNYRVWKP